MGLSSIIVETYPGLGLWLGHIRVTPRKVLVQMLAIHC